VPTSDQEAFNDLLSRVQDGDREALNRLVPLVYEELQELARVQRRRWQGSLSVQTTSLLHEAYVRLAGQEAPRWTDRAHFMAVAATAMRQILIDHARRRSARKRGGDRKKVSLDEFEAILASASPSLEARDEVIVVLDECLAELRKVDARAVRIVECRFFAGMTIAEAAEALGVSPATVTRSWGTTRAWLYRELRTRLGD
jgi:RNA polymerase sigma factor (TIGR02999 family)